MPIKGLVQPAFLRVDQNLRLRRYDGVCDFALPWYRDPETVYLVDGVMEPYDMQKLRRMYTYLDARGECYFIEILSGERYVPIGDVTFWRDDLPIVIGERQFRHMGIGKRILSVLIDRARSLGYDALRVNEIYDWNISSKRCFMSLGFIPCEATEKGHRYRLIIK